MPSRRRSARTQNRATIPGLVYIFAALGLSLLIIPLAALLIEAPWTEMFGLFTDADTLEAVKVSMVVSLSAAVLSTLFGVPLASVLARLEFRGKAIVRTIVSVPLVLPPVVTGVAMLYGFGRRGLIGRFLGLELPFTTVGAVLAATIVAMPFLILSVEGALRNVDPRFEQMAASLGARPLARWFQITLPMIRPSILSGMVLAWARALGEFGATITFAGNLPGVTQTLPLKISTAFEQDPEQALALSVLMLVVALTVLVALRDRWVPRR